MAEEIEAAEKHFRSRPWCRLLKSGSLREAVEFGFAACAGSPIRVDDGEILGIGCFAGSRRRPLRLWMPGHVVPMLRGVTARASGASDAGMEHAESPARVQ
jgi:hypothetical protein